MQRDLTILNTESARDARETLERLEDMAQDRLDLFYEKIGCAFSRPRRVPHCADVLCDPSHDDWDKHLIPINGVLNKYTYIGVAAEEDNAVWMQEVKEAVKEFAIGPIADGFSSVATNTIVKMLGSSSGRRHTTQR